MGVWLVLATSCGVDDRTVTVAGPEANSDVNAEAVDSLSHHGEIVGDESAPDASPEAGPAEEPVACEPGTPCGSAPSECSAPPMCDGMGACVSTPLPAGLALDRLGCNARACDGQGGSVIIPDDTLCPSAAPRCQPDGSCGECRSVDDCAPSGPCMIPSCNQGACSEVPREAGAECGAGSEVCSDVDRCDGAGSCSLHHFPTSHVLDDPEPGDCQGLRCDGNGGTEPFTLDTDVPLDSDPLDCNVPSCSNGELIESNRPPDAPCSDGLFCTELDRCNDAGVCVGSGDPCPGRDGGSNCADSCDEQTDSCTQSDPRGSSCGAAPLRCDGSGSCHSCLEDAECPDYGGGRAGFCIGGRCLECLEDSDCNVTCEQGVCVTGSCRNIPLCGGSGSL